MGFILRDLSLTVLLASIAIPSHAHGITKAREIKVAVTEQGFVPSSIKVKAGHPVLLVITRKTDRTCATEAVFPSLGKTFDLPLNQAVRVALPPEQAGGRIDFACAMGMRRARILVQ